MSPMAFALRTLRHAKPDLFRTPRPGRPLAVPRPPLLKSGDYMGAAWQRIVSPSGVLEASAETWVEQFWWVTDGLADGIDINDIREQLLLSIKLNSKQRRWMLPKVIARRPDAFPMLFAFVLHGLVATNRARIKGLDNTSFVVEYEGAEMGIRDGQVIGTTVKVAPFNYRRYLRGDLPCSPCYSYSHRYNTVYREAAKAKDDEALLLLRATFWNTPQLQRVESLVTSPLDTALEQQEQGVDDDNPDTGSYW